MGVKMSDNDIDVKIGADIGGVKSGMADASSSIKTALGEINTSMMASIAAGTALGSVVGNVLVSAFSHLSSSIKESVSETAAYYGEAAKLGRAFGTTATEAGTLMQMLDNAHVTTEEYSGAAKGLEKQINKNEVEMNKMGLTTRDATGHLRPLNDLMMDAIKITNSHREGTDRNIAATQLFGKGIADGSKILKLNAEAAEEARKSNDELGLTIGVEGAKNASAYKEAMKDVEDAMQGFSKVIGDAVMPIITKLAVWFREIAPYAITVFKGAIGGLMTVFWGFKLGVEVVFEAVLAAIETLGTSLATLLSVTDKALHGDWAGAKAAWNKGGSELADIAARHLDRVSASAEEAKRNIANLFMRDEDQTKKESGGDLSTATKEKKDKVSSIIPQLKAELDHRIETELGYFKESTTLELAFWQEKLSTVAKGSKDYATIEHTMFELKKKLAHEALSDELETIKLQIAAQNQAGDERVRLAQIIADKTAEKYGAGSREHIKALRDVNAEEVALNNQRLARAQQVADLERDLALGGVEIERMAIEQKLALGQMTAINEIEALKALEEKKYQIELKAAYAKAALIKDDVVAYEAALNKIAIDEQKHNTQMAALDNKAALEKRKVFQSVADGIGSAFTKAFSGILKGTMSLGDAMKSIFTGIFDAVLGALMDFVGKWIAQQIMMRIFGAATAKGDIVTSAAKAGAAGTASFAAAPWPIDMGAPAFGASMAAAASAYAGFSAEGGFDIPAGVNPLVQTHQKEMILPAEHAETIRNLKNGASGGNTFHISAIDAAGVKKFLMTHGSVLADSLKAQARNFKVTAK